MEEEWAAALRGFDAVWQRVQGGPEPQTRAAEAPLERGTALERAICGEAAGAHYYQAVARLTEGRSADALHTMAAECGQSLKRLQTEYFLETGDTLPTEYEPLPFDGLLGYLRRAYLREGAAARTYLEFAASAEREALGLLYGELSGLCSRRREKLYGLVGRMLG